MGPHARLILFQVVPLLYSCSLDVASSGAFIIGSYLLGQHVVGSCLSHEVLRLCLHARLRDASSCAFIIGPHLLACCLRRCYHCIIMLLRMLLQVMPLLELRICEQAKVAKTNPMCIIEAVGCGVVWSMQGFHPCCASQLLSPRSLSHVSNSSDTQTLKHVVLRH